MTLEYNECMLLLNGCLTSKVSSKRGQEGVGFALSRNAVLAWKAPGSEIYTDQGSRIIAIQMLVKDAKGKDIGIFLISAYSPIGAASNDIWSDYMSRLDIIMSRKRNSDVLIIGCDCNSSLGTTSLGNDAMFKSSIGKFQHNTQKSMRYSFSDLSRNM